MVKNAFTLKELIDMHNNQDHSLLELDKKVVFVEDGNVYDDLQFKNFSTRFYGFMEVPNMETNGYAHVHTSIADKEVSTFNPFYKVSSKDDWLLEQDPSAIRFTPKDIIGPSDGMNGLSYLLQIGNPVVVASGPRQLAGYVYEVSAKRDLKGIFILNFRIGLNNPLEMAPTIDNRVDGARSIYEGVNSMTLRSDQKGYKVSLIQADK